MSAQKDGWTIEKKVPAALIVTILLGGVAQYVSIKSYMVQTDAKLTNHESRLAQQETAQAGAQQGLYSVNIKLAVMDNKIETQTELLKEIKKDTANARN